MTLDELKLYLGIDGTDEDTLLNSLQLSAEEYMTNAGIVKNYNKELYKLAIKILVSNWHENRLAQGEKTSAKMLFSLDAIVTQLKYTQTI